MNSFRGELTEISSGNESLVTSQVHAGRKADKLRYRYPSGESYQDIIQRLEPVVIEAERQKESVVIIAHQAILRVLYGYFMKIPIQDVRTAATRPVMLSVLVFKIKN